jgi:hypothetical protein
MLITRNGEVMVPKGKTHLQGWDQVIVLAHTPDEDSNRATFM